MKRGKILKGLALKKILTNRPLELYIYVYLILSAILGFFLKKDILILGNLFILLGILSLLLIKNERLLLFFTVIVSLFHSGISSFINGTYIVMYAYILMLIYLLISKQKIKVDKTILIVSMVTLFFSLIPLLINGTSVSLLFFSILKRFGFIIVYIFVLNMRSITGKLKRNLIKFIIIALIINFIAALVQFFQGGIHQDFITGFFGGGTTGIVIYIFMFYIAFLSGWHYKKRISTLVYLMFILIPVVYAAIAEVKVGFITTVLLLTIYLVIINRSYKSFFYLVIFGLIFINLYNVFVNLYPEHDFLKREFLESYLIEQEYGTGGTINRFDFKSQIDSIIFSDQIEATFGMGLGSGNPSEGELLKGSLYNQYDYLKFTWFTLPYLYVETGIIGTITYIMIYFITLMVSIKVFLKNRSPLSVILILMSLTNFLYVPYNAGLLDYAITTVYWILFAFLKSEKKGNKESC